MKIQKSKIILIVLLVIILLSQSSTYSFAVYNEYVIEDYDIDMVVNEDNTFDITENITTYFNISKHGIYRKIPLKNTITRVDGTTSKNTAQIYNLSVSENYSVSKENGYEVIKIGDSRNTVSGSHSYTIKYTYNIGKDPLKDMDELYYNLIGEEWDTNIQNVTFRITMPKSFDKSLLGFSSGFKGSIVSLNVNYSVDGNVISGTINNTLLAGQGLTVRLTLPDGYFVGAGLKWDMFCIGIMLISLIFVLIADRIWRKYGKDDEIVDTVEFYPPEGYNSAEIALLYEGHATDKGVISLLIYLANKGYLKIEETREKGLNKKRI